MENCVTLVGLINQWMSSFCWGLLNCQMGSGGIFCLGTFTFFGTHFTWDAAAGLSHMAMGKGLLFHRDLQSILIVSLLPLWLAFPHKSPGLRQTGFLLSCLSSIECTPGSGLLGPSSSVTNILVPLLCICSSISFFGSPHCCVSDLLRFSYYLSP